MAFHSPFLSSIAFLVLMLSGLPISQLRGQTRPTAQEVSLEKKIIEGKKYTLLGDWEKAEAIFRAILQEDVQNSAACYELSRTLTAAGKTGEALTFIHKAIRIEPDNEWYQLMEADIHEKSGDLFAAMEMYDRLILLRPQKVHYYEMQINFCKKTGEHERLLIVLDQYEKIKGVNESITRTRFETLDALGRSAEALNALHRLTEVFPSNISYKFLAASYAKKINREEKAFYYYRDILQLEPENARAKLALAGTEKQAGNESAYLQSIVSVINNPVVDIDLKIQELIPYVVQLSKSNSHALQATLIELTGQLVKTHPREAKAFAIQGDVLAIAGLHDEAITSYKASTQFHPGVYGVWEQLLSLLMNERSYDELFRQAYLAMEHFPNQVYIYYAAGYGSYKKKEFNKALELLNEALIMTGRNAGQKISIYNILGLVYDELGDLEKSSFAFETALNIDSKNPETLVYYSLTLSRRIAQSDKAMTMTEKIMHQEDIPPGIREVLALVLYHQRKYNEAYTSIQKVLETEPHGDAYNLAGDISLKLGHTTDAVDMWQRAIETGCTDPDVKRKIAEHKAQ